MVIVRMPERGKPSLYAARGIPCRPGRGLDSRRDVIGAHQDSAGMMLGLSGLLRG